MKLTTLLTACIVLVAGATQIWPGTTEEDWGRLASLPGDSAELVDLRIWLPQEQKAPCTLKVDIFDSDETLVRHLLDMQIRPGYFNIWWDKMDAAGQRVAEGSYSYRVNDCGGSREGQLKVSYVKWELDSKLTVEPIHNTVSIKLAILNDSAKVTLELFDYNDELMEDPWRDRWMYKGAYTYSAPADLFTKKRKPVYLLLRVDDYLRRADIKAGQ